MYHHEHIQLNEASDRTHEDFLKDDKDESSTEHWLFYMILITTSGVVLGSTVIEILNITYILPLSECELHWSMQDKGILSVSAVLGVLFGSLFWGSLADTYGRRRVLYPTLLMTFLLTTLSSFTVSFWSLFLLRFSSGLFISAGAGVIIPYLGEFFSSKNRDLAIFTASMILGLICVLLPFLASLVINTELSWEIPFIYMNYKPWRLFMFISGVPNLITGALLYFLPESPTFILSKGRNGSALHVFKNVESNGRRLSTNYHELETTNSSIWKQTKSLLSKKHLRLTLTISALHFLVFAVGAMGSWYPEIVNSVTSYIKENHNETATICEIYRKRMKPIHDKGVCLEKFEISTYWFVIFSEILFVLVILTYSIVVRWTSKPVLLSLTFLFTFVSIILIAFVRNPQLALYLFTSFVWSRALVMILAAIMVEHYPTNMRSIATCVANIVGRVSYFMASNYIAILLEYHCEKSFFIAAFWLLLGFVSCFFLPKVRHNDLLEN